MLLHCRSGDSLRSAFDVCLNSGTTRQALQRNIESCCRSKRRKCCNGCLGSDDSDHPNLSLTYVIRAQVPSNRPLLHRYHVCICFHWTSGLQLSRGAPRACGVSVGRLVVYARNMNSLDILWVAGLVTSFRHVSALCSRKLKLTQNSVLEINIGIVCGAAISLPVLFSNKRNGIGDLVSRLGTRWTRIDPTVITSNNLTVLPCHHDISRCSVRLEDNLSVADRIYVLENASQAMSRTEEILNDSI